MEFKRHFGNSDLEKLFDSDFELPDDFMFGVANAAYQVEGGLNGEGEPLNNWVELERSGKAEVSGEAIRFWTDYPEQIEMAKDIGLNTFRMSVEWARVQPRTSPSAGDAPPFDQAAIEAYSDMIASIMKAGMEPIVTLHHFTHPYWLGMDFWLDRDRLDLFRVYVEEMATRLNQLLVEKHSLRPVKYWVTINEPNLFPLLTYTARMFPHSESGLGANARAWGNMIEAHCRAYDAIHETHKRYGWENPLVSYNTFHWSTYYLDKVMTDLLLARRNGVERRDLAAYLEKSKAAWDDEVARCPEVREAPWINMKLESLLDRLSARAFSLERLSDGIDAIYSSSLADKLDFLAVDYYDPFFRHQPKLPSLQDMRQKRFLPVAELWEQILNPQGLYHFLKAEAINADGLPLIVVESGMCYQVRQGRVAPRLDGATRDRFLQSYLYEVLRALKDGLPVKGYLHWTMVDNYEWGSYMPRFGLYTVDRSRTPVRMSSVDAWGVNAGKAYGELINALKSGDRGRIVAAFLRNDW